MFSNKVAAVLAFSLGISALHCSSGDDDSLDLLDGGGASNNGNTGGSGADNASGGNSDTPDPTTGGSSTTGGATNGGATASGGESSGGMSNGGMSNGGMSNGSGGSTGGSSSGGTGGGPNGECVPLGETGCTESHDPPCCNGLCTWFVSEGMNRCVECPDEGDPCAGAFDNDCCPGFTCTERGGVCVKD